MPTVPIYNVEGKTIGNIELDPKVFDAPLKPKVVQFVVVAQQANAFVPYAHTKTRGEVRGGGRKPWRQKGTGRARQGSIRSPQWVGGGIVFGPRSTRNPHQKINKKVRHGALRMVLSDKLRNQQLVVIQNFDGITGKTKEFATVLNKLPLNRRSAIIATGVSPTHVVRAAQNISHIQTMRADSINVRDLLQYTYLIMDQEGIEKITALLTARI